MSLSIAPGIARPRPGAIYWTGLGLFALLLVLLAAHAIGVLLDFRSALLSPFERDYGEGIVWQQAALMLGPRMYPMGQELPFIVFHYPPVYHLLVRAVSRFTPDMLMAGRAVSELAALAVVPLVAGLVMLSTPRVPGRRRGLPVLVAVAAGLLALCLHAVRDWGMVMRVDMVAIALGLAGVLVAAWADGRLWGTTAGLLLCVAAVYTKQTQLPAGLAIFCVLVVRWPAATLGAAAIAGAVGLGVLYVLQERTGGGFLHNIISYNINRYSIRHAYWVFWPERTSLPFMALMVVAGAWTLWRLWGLQAPGFRWRQVVHMVRGLDRAQATRLLVLAHFGLATLMLFTIFKSGGSFNYLLDWLCVGCVLLGVFVSDLLATRTGFLAVTAVLVLAMLVQPLRLLPDRFPQGELDRLAELEQRIAAAPLPVASENMTLLMRAGKSVVYEPSIAAELAEVGRWDERPLIEMIWRHGFAFMITTDNTSRSTPAVEAAMHEAYPRVEQVGPKLFFNYPADPPRP